MANSEGSKYTNSWDGVCAAAKDSGAKFPELVAAQWALESGWGKHLSGKNNYFGIKGEGTAKTTKEFENGKEITVTAEFQDFSDLGECVSHLVERWYKDWKQYKGVNHEAHREGAARGLVKQGYATDPVYAEKLIKLMNEKAPKTPASTPTGEQPVLFRIEATTDTWLKKACKNASELGAKEKVAVPTGKVYAVSAYTEEPRDAHAKVVLGDGAGVWYVYEPHWRRNQAVSEAVPASVNWGDFNAQVTTNLTVGEILQWDKRRIPGPNASVRARLLNTAEEFQKIRDAWGRALGVTSFYRPEPINGQVGGVPGSRHTTGEAMDVYPSDGSLEAFYQWIRCRWTGGLGDGRRKGFVHLDTRGDGHFVPGAGVRPVTEWDY